MSQDKEATGRFDLLKSLRAVRDSVGTDLAKVVIAVTSSRVYQRANALVAAPALLASALLRERREALMSELLSQLHMPSREDVLSLSQRLTRIEMALDDLGAGMDQLRRPASRPQRAAARESSGRESSEVRSSGVLSALTPSAPKSKEA